MRIKNHFLFEDENTQVKFVESPNHSGSFIPDSIIIHYTAGRNAEGSIRTLCNRKRKASAHLVIAKDGAVTQLVPFNKIAWHAGKSYYKGRSGFNKYSIGIEIDNAGILTKQGNKFLSWFNKEYSEDEVFKGVHRNQKEDSYWQRYSEVQIEKVEEICDLLIDEYNINLILGHEEIAPTRKIDPGPAFPLDKMRDRLLYSDRENENISESVIEDSEELNNLGIVTANKLNIRFKPSITATKVSNPLEKGTLLDIIEESGDWYKVKVNISGWVSKKYVKT